MDTKTLTDTETFEREMVPVIIVEVEGFGMGQCYCTSIEQVADTLRTILGENAHDGDWRHWPEDGQSFIHISTSQREKTWVENLPPWEL